MKAILTNLMQLAGLQLILAFTGLMRNKVVAVQLGPAGLGEFTQLFVFFTALGTIIIFGLSVGISRNVAATQEVGDRQRILNNANFIVSAISFLVCSGLIVGFNGGFFSFEVIGVDSSSTIVAASLFLLISLPLKALETNYIAFLTGIMDIKGMMSGRGIAVVIGTAISIPIVWFFGFIGAAIQYMLITTLFVVLLGRRIKKLGYRPYEMNWHLPTVYGLAYFGIASLANGFVQNGSDVSIRAMFVKSIGDGGLMEVGLYSAALALATQIKAIVIGGVCSLSLAALSKSQERDDIVLMVNQLLKVVLPVAALTFAALGAFGVFILHVLNSNEFTAAARYFPFMLGADFIQAFIWVVGAPLLALKKVSIWFVFDLIQWSVKWIMVMALLPICGPQTIVIAYFLSTLLHLGLNIYYYFSVLELQHDKEHFLQLLLGLIAVVTCSCLGATGKIVHTLMAAFLLLCYGIWLVHSVIGFAQLQNIMKERLKGLP